jgi:aerobic carbon-monoxide dehydrogenase medium subunit
VKPAGFAYFRADSIEAALQQLTAGAELAKVIAGGQSFAPMLNMRLARPAQLIDLNDLTELAYIRDVGNALEIGALTRHEDVARSTLVQTQCPLLAQAARTIGHYAIRQRGTLGGSLAHADPAAQLSLVAVAQEARIEVVSTRGTRTVRAADFFLSAMTTDLAPDEIVRSVRFPKSGENEGTSFQLFNRRSGDFAIVAAAVGAIVRDGYVAHLRIGISGVDAVPKGFGDVVGSFQGRLADARCAADVASAVRAAVDPDDDPQIPAIYRKELTEALVERALLRAFGRATG